MFGPLPLWGTDETVIAGGGGIVFGRRGERGGGQNLKKECRWVRVVGGRGTLKNTLGETTEWGGELEGGRSQN